MLRTTNDSNLRAAVAGQRYELNAEDVKNFLNCIH